MTQTICYEEIMQGAALALEAFRDDVLPELHINDLDIDIQVIGEPPRDMALRVIWHWDRIQKTNKKNFPIVSERDREVVVERVKSYFYDIIISVINLA